MNARSAETESARDHRIRERAYHLWEADGRPHGRDAEFWERARELIGMEDSAGAGLLDNPQVHPNTLTGFPPGVDEAAIQQNLGEFPGRFTDEGDREETPEVRPSRRAPREPAAVIPSAKPARPRPSKSPRSS